MVAVPYCQLGSALGWQHRYCVAATDSSALAFARGRNDNQHWARENVEQKSETTTRAYFVWNMIGMTPMAVA